MVIAWSGLAYAVAKPAPGGVPRRVQMPNTWDVKTTWTVAGVRRLNPNKPPFRTLIFLATPSCQSMRRVARVPLRMRLRHAHAAMLRQDITAQHTARAGAVHTTPAHHTAAGVSAANRVSPCRTWQRSLAGRSEAR